MPNFEARVTTKLADLKDWCACNGVTITPAGEVDGPTACRLIGYTSKHTLERWTAEGRLPATLRRRRCGPKLVYTLESIARYIEEQYDRWSVGDVT